MFLQDEANKAIMIKINNNNLASEPNKTFRVKLIGANDKAFIYPNTEVVVTIIDNDGKYWNIQGMLSIL